MTAERNTTRIRTEIYLTPALWARLDAYAKSRELPRSITAAILLDRALRDIDRKAMQSGVGAGGWHGGQ